MTTAAETNGVTGTEVDSRPLSQRLKEDNWDLHHKAERDPLPQHMVKGSIPKETFVELTAVMTHAHKALDAAILEHRDSVPMLKNMVEDRQLQGPYYEADCAHWGVDARDYTPGAGVKKLIDRIGELSASDPLGLFGLHYVREGAMNGNRFVAMKIRKSWGIDMVQADGFRSLDAYGKDQRPLWDAFKTRLDEQDLSEDEKKRVVGAAREMFELIMGVHADFDLPPVPADDEGEGGHG